MLDTYKAKDDNERLLNRYSNAEALIKATQKGKTPLYYNPSTDTVYTKPGEGRYHLTDLLIPHDAEMIKKTVKHFMAY